MNLHVFECFIGVLSLFSESTVVDERLVKSIKIIILSGINHSYEL